MSEQPSKPDTRKEAATRRPVLAELAGLDVAIVTARDDQGIFLVRELQRLRVRTRHLWPAPERMPSDTDVVYCDYAHDLARRLPWVPGDAQAALVIILPAADPIDPEALTNATPDAILARPFTANAVLASLVSAQSQFRYELRLRGKVEKLDDTIRSMRTVERAKAIIMTTRRVAEDEAYGFIRRQAMDRRVPVSAVAAAIVDSFELLGYDLKQ